MQDEPSAGALLAEVEAGLAAGIAPGLQQRIAANAVALACRETELAAEFAQAEAARLRALLDAAGDAAVLNQRLADAIRDRALDLASPRLVQHLWLTTIEKMRIDQPRYPAFVAWLTDHEEELAP